MLSDEERKSMQASLEDGSVEMASMFNALGDQTRFGIFRLLSEKRDACVSDIAGIMNISVPAASHHLKILEQSGLARRERMGQMICYRLREDDTIVRTIMQLIEQ